MQPQKWDYSFTAWPDEKAFRPGVYELFRAGLNTRVMMTFTEPEWERFRDDVEAAGLTFREVERVPYHDPEPVSVL